MLLLQCVCVHMCTTKYKSCTLEVNILLHTSCGYRETASYRTLFLPAHDFNLVMNLSDNKDLIELFLASSLSWVCYSMKLDWS